jgi:hypothetical protein
VGGRGLGAHRLARQHAAVEFKAFQAVAEAHLVDLITRKIENTVPIT